MDDGVELVRGSRRYELSDWLGNVRVVVSDARVPVRQGGRVRGYRAEVVSVGDYYSFRAEIRARSYEIASVYCYGYQAQERDDEVYGRGASYYYRYRQHDARLGRFWSVDPLARKYPYYSPYSFSGNRLVDAVEWEGLEPRRLPQWEGEVRKAPEAETGKERWWVSMGTEWLPSLAPVEIVSSSEEGPFFRFKAAFTVSTSAYDEFPALFHIQANAFRVLEGELSAGVEEVRAEGYIEILGWDQWEGNVGVDPSHSDFRYGGVALLFGTRGTYYYGDIEKQEWVFPFLTVRQIRAPTTLESGRRVVSERTQVEVGIGVGAEMGLLVGLGWKIEGALVLYNKLRVRENGK